MKHKATKISIFIVLILLNISCQHANKFDVDVSKIPAKVDIERFDLAFYGQDPKNLPKIKKQFPILFPPKMPDSIWTKKMNDSLVSELKKEVDKKFKNMQAYKSGIAALFKHIKYYQKDFKEPKIITLYSDWDYMKRAVYKDTLLFLALDNFLGEKNPIYKGIPVYIRHNLDPKRIPIEIGKSIIETQVKPPKSKSFVNKMINYGKQLYLLDAYVPNTADSLKIGYTAKKMKWARENEEMIWKYFISKKLLYNTLGTLDFRFLNPAPYSKFYSPEDTKTPGKIGQYMGWQIVRQFMQKNEVSLQKLIQMDEEEIFKQSKFKPRR